jgi:hypothetical protein
MKVQKTYVYSFILRACIIHVSPLGPTYKKNINGCFTGLYVGSSMPARHRELLILG